MLGQISYMRRMMLRTLARWCPGAERNERNPPARPFAASARAGGRGRGQGRDMEGSGKEKHKAACNQIRFVTLLCPDEQ
jgi:hypothetical protein